VLRAALVAALLPIVAVLHATLVVAVFVPFDPALLDTGNDPLVIVDVHGDEIATLPAVGADRTQRTRLDELPAIAISAVVQSEDERFWDHRGVDGVGLVRAGWLDAQGGRFGGSTLTMQLARMLLGTTTDRTATNKLREVLLALRIERAVDKRTILEQWMNRAYFGNGAYGFDAAARLYFGKPAAALSPGEAALLAVIPRAPTAYDPLVHPDAVRARRDRVLALLVSRGVLDDGEAAAARAEQPVVARHDRVDRAPAFVRWAVAQLPADVRAAGGTLHATLDLRLQRVIAARVVAQVAERRAEHVEEAGVVVLDTATTGVRAMVGSTGDSDVDITTRRRHPGSALKPFVYATAIERGASPSSIAWDTRDTSDDYFAPSGGVEHGPVRYRTALASSYNFAAVSVLDQVGVPRVMSVLRQAGVAELPGAPDDYGLRLALGAAKVRLLDLAAGYGFLVKDGTVGTPYGVELVERADGSRWLPPQPGDRRVFSPAASWLVMDMLSDPEARRPGFGVELPFDLPFPIAAKTGTARGFADTWAVGATREVIVGAWAGTFDGTATHGVVGMDAAAPLVRDGMLAVADGRRLTLPDKPDDVVAVEVCAVSGLAPGPHCPHVHDYTVRGRPAAPPCDWHDERGAVHYPAQGRGWMARTGR
jgi:penicillin-binding protein 1C